MCVLVVRVVERSSIRASGMEMMSGTVDKERAWGKSVVGVGRKGRDMLRLGIDVAAGERARLAAKELGIDVKSETNRVKS